MSQDRFEQLSTEIVAFVQACGHDTVKCREFVLYELRLRCISKDRLSELANILLTEAQQRDEVRA